MDSAIDFENISDKKAKAHWMNIYAQIDNAVLQAIKNGYRYFGVYFENNLNLEKEPYGYTTNASMKAANDLNEFERGHDWDIKDLSLAPDYLKEILK